MMYQSKVEMLKEINRRDVKENLDEIILRYILENKSIHGYELIKKIKKDFGILFSASEIYPQLWNLEKKGVLTSREIKAENGKYRREYSFVEGKTLEYLRTLRDVKNRNRSILNKKSTASLSVQVIRPEYQKVET
ncbi:MAG: helix-turn-helix transcriptional regulator [Candidatus Aenigmatarchaeota archaeon]